VFRAPLLTGLAHAWIVDQPLHPADAIILLGGGMETRPFAAARLYREGHAPKILVMKPRPGPTTKLGLTVAEADIAQKILLQQGVPETAIVFPTEEVTSTYEESLAVRNWAATNQVKTIIIPTDIFHTRRVNWLFHTVLEDSPVEIQVTAVPPQEYAATNWWQHEEGLIAFQNEVIKYAFYRMKY
jgi:uncharacterized SAM-binding protein YcdF (DUF218 family)